MEKIQIRDKHTGSATLTTTNNINIFSPNPLVKQTGSLSHTCFDIFVVKDRHASDENIRNVAPYAVVKLPES
jgi:hypothetical protein